MSVGLNNEVIYEDGQTVHLVAFDPDTTSRFYDMFLTAEAFKPSVTFSWHHNDSLNSHLRLLLDAIIDVVPYDSFSPESEPYVAARFIPNQSVDLSRHEINFNKVKISHLSKVFFSFPELVTEKLFQVYINGIDSMIEFSIDSSNSLRVAFASSHFSSLMTLITKFYNSSDEVKDNAKLILRNFYQRNSNIEI